jgi:hypothetical protein
LQLGIITPTQRWEALKNWFMSRQIKNFAHFIAKPQGYQYTNAPIEEINQLLRGIQVPVLPQGDHEGFLQLWEEFKNNDELLGQFNEQQTILVEVQARKHAQMLQALQAQQAQLANTQQQQMNAQQSGQQAPIAGPATEQGAM